MCRRTGFARVVFYVVCVLIFVGLVEAIVAALVIVLALAGAVAVGHILYRAIESRRD